MVLYDIVIVVIRRRLEIRMNVSQTTDTREPGHTRRLRTSRRRARRGSRRGAIGNELRAWAEVIDGLLVAIEETAWAARGLAEAAEDVARAGQRDLRARSVDASRMSEDVARFAQTGWMLTRMAAGYRLHRLQAAFVSRERAKRMLASLHGTSARRFYETSVRHGGAFLKVGQLLSARGDLLPDVWIRELSVLQDRAPTIPFEAVRGVIEGEFGALVSDLFAEFDETPIAAASIGQVHRAVTKDGLVVAVKVQRPGIGPRVEADLGLLEAFVHSLDDSLPDADYDTIIAQIRRAVLAEVDYVMEAQTATVLADFFSGHPGIVVPRPVANLCSARVLTTKFAPGEKITNVLDRLAESATNGDGTAHAELSRILGLLLEAYLRQVLEAGVFQADPHPGNLLVTPEGKLVVLDFGCSESLPADIRGRYLGLLRAFVAGDRAEMARLFDEIGFRTASGKADTLEQFAGAFLSEIRQLALSQAVAWPTREELSRRFGGLLSACQDDPVTSIPGEFVMMGRVFGTLGGLFQTYQPRIDFVQHVLPILGAALI